MFDESPFSPTLKENYCSEFLERATNMNVKTKSKNYTEFYFEFQQVKNFGGSNSLATVK